MDEILIEKPKFSNLFLKSYEISIRNRKLLFKISIFYFTLYMLLRGIDLKINTLYKPIVTLLIHFMIGGISIFLLGIPEIGISFFVRDKLYGNTDKTFKEYLKKGKEDVLKYGITSILLRITILIPIIIIVAIFVIMLLIMQKVNPLISIILLIVMILGVIFSLLFSIYFLFCQEFIIYNKKYYLTSLIESYNLVKDRYRQVFEIVFVLIFIVLIVNAPVILLSKLYVENINSTQYFIIYMLVQYITIFINIVFVVFQKVLFLTLEANKIQERL